MKSASRACVPPLNLGSSPTQPTYPRHPSTTSNNVVSDPTLPGKTIYGIPDQRLVFSWHSHKGTPGAAWPTTSALFIPRPFVAISEEVMPPCKSSVGDKRKGRGCLYLCDDIARPRLQSGQEVHQRLSYDGTNIQTLGAVFASHEISTGHY